MQAQRQLPLSVVVIRESNVRAIRDPRSTQCANAEHELLKARDPATDLWMADFGLVQWDHHREKADTVAVSFDASSLGEICATPTYPTPAKKRPLYK